MAHLCLPAPIAQLLLDSQWLGYIRAVRESDRLTRIARLTRSRYLGIWQSREDELLSCEKGGSLGFDGINVPVDSDGLADNMCFFGSGVRVDGLGQGGV